MLGYKETDVIDMIGSIDLAMGLIDTPENSWVYNNLFRSKDLLEGLLAEGHIS